MSSLAAFLGSGASMSSLPWKLRVRSQDYGLADLPTSPPYAFAPGRPSPGTPSLLRHRFGNNGHQTGQECLPAGHRLRLSASA
jgi:hypothetical protein